MILDLICRKRNLQHLNRSGSSTSLRSRPTAKYMKNEALSELLTDAQFPLVIKIPDTSGA